MDSDRQLSYFELKFKKALQETFDPDVINMILTNTDRNIAFKSKQIEKYLNRLLVSIVIFFITFQDFGITVSAVGMNIANIRLLTPLIVVVITLNITFIWYYYVSNAIQKRLYAFVLKYKYPPLHENNIQKMLYDDYLLEDKENSHWFVRIINIICSIFSYPLLFIFMLSILVPVSLLFNSDLIMKAIHLLNSDIQKDRIWALYYISCYATTSSLVLYCMSLLGSGYTIVRKAFVKNI